MSLSPSRLLGALLAVALPVAGLTAWPVSSAEAAAATCVDGTWTLTNGTCSKTFGYLSSNTQQFTPPSGLSSFDIVMKGGSGGAGGSGTPATPGGGGGVLKATVQVTPSMNYFMLVGGQGSKGSNSTVGGGGAAGGSTTGSGGGGSYLYTNMAVVAVAGGGGGAGSTFGVNGGSGSGSAPAGNGTTASSTAAGGGTASSGGAGGSYGGSTGGSGTGSAMVFNRVLTVGQGGAGNQGPDGGGGGGGGYYGGGGGLLGGSGGGGSGYASSSLSNVTTDEAAGGLNSNSAGSIRITYSLAQTATSPSDVSSLFGQGGAGCGGTVKLADTFAASASDQINASCGDAGATLDLNGKSFTLGRLSAISGKLTVINSSSTPATVTGPVGLGGRISGTPYAGTLRVEQGVSVVANGSFVETAQSAASIPGVYFGVDGSKLEIAGGSLSATAGDGSSAAIGTAVSLDSSGAQVVGGTGSIVVSSGSLTATGQGGDAAAIGGASTRGVGGAPIPVTVSGGTLTVNAGSPTAVAIGAGTGYSGSPVPSVTIAGSAQTATTAKLVIAQGTIISSGLQPGQSTTETYNVVENNGALLPDPTSHTVGWRVGLKVTGYNYQLNLGDTGGTVRVAAKTLASGGVDVPEGHWKLEDGTVLTSSTDLSAIEPNTTNGATGLATIRLTSYTPAISVGYYEDLIAALTECDGTPSSPTLVQVSDEWDQPTDPEQMPAITLGCSVSLDLNGQSVDLGGLRAGSNRLVLADGAAAGSKGSVTTGVSLTDGGALSVEGARLVVPSGSSLSAPAGSMITVDDSSFVDLTQGTLATEFSPGGGGTQISNSGTIVLAADAGIPAVGSISGHAYLLLFDTTPGDVNDQPDSMGLVLAKTVADQGATFDLPTPDAPSGKKFDGWTYTPEGGEPVQVTKSTDLAQLMGTATGGAVQARLVATFSDLPAQTWNAITPLLPVPKTGVEISATLMPTGASDTLPQAMSWKWQRSVDGSSWTDIVNATGTGKAATYTPTSGDVGQRLQVVWTSTKDGYADKTTTSSTASKTTWGPITTAADLATALSSCAGTRSQPMELSLTLGADITATSGDFAVGTQCSLTLDLAGRNLTLPQIGVPTDAVLTVNDAGRAGVSGQEGDRVYGVLTLGSATKPPFALEPNSSAGSGSTVTLKAKLALGGIVTVPDGATFTVDQTGLVTEVAGTTARLQGDGAINIFGAVASAVEVSGSRVSSTTKHTVTFHLPAGSDPATTTVTVYGPSLDAVGQTFPEVAAGDGTYVRWGTAAGGGAWVRSTSALSGSTIDLYPSQVPTGTAVVASLADLQSSLASFGTAAGQFTTIRLAGDITAADATLTLPVLSTTAAPVVLDLFGHELSLGKVDTAGGALRVSDTSDDADGDLKVVSASGSNAFVGNGSLTIASGTVKTRGLSTDKVAVTVGTDGVLVGLPGTSGEAFTGERTLTNNGLIMVDPDDVDVQIAPNNATVTYDVAGGTLPQGVTSTRQLYASSFDQADATLPTPTRTHYTFAGWMKGDTVFTSSSSLPQAQVGNPATGGITPGAATLKATWTPESTTVSSVTALQEALADGWPIVTIPAGTTFDLGTTSVDLGAARLVVGAGATVIGTGAITGATGAVIENHGVITAPVASGYAGRYVGDVHAFTFPGVGASGADLTVAVLASSLTAAGVALPAGPVIAGKRFLGWKASSEASSFVTAADVLTPSTTAGVLTPTSLVAVYETRPATTSVGSAADLVEALRCANGITGPVSIRLTGPVSLSEPVSSTCAAAIDLNGQSLTVSGLTLGADLSVAGGTLSVASGTLGLTGHTLTIASSGAVTGGVLAALSAGDGGTIANNGTLAWPAGIGTGSSAVPVTGHHYAVSFIVPEGVSEVASATVFSGSSGELPAPTRAGYVFKGWNTKVDGTGTFVTAASDLGTVFGLSVDGTAKPAAVYAIWEAIPVVVPPAPSGSPTTSPTASPTASPTGEPSATLPPAPSVPSISTGPTTGTGSGSGGGVPQVGVPVTVSVSLPDVPGAVASYQWQVVKADGTVVDIPGATGASYTPSGEDAGSVLQVVVTTTAPGYAPSVQIVKFSRSGQIRLGVITTTKVAVKALKAVKKHPVVGRTIRAKVSRAWLKGLPVGAVVTYRWTANGTTITTATGNKSVLRIGRKLVGKRLRLVVKVSAPGYTPVTLKAKPTKKVVRGRR